MAEICVNINTPEFKRLLEDNKPHTSKYLQAKVAVWQERNNESRIPDQYELFDTFVTSNDDTVEQKIKNSFNDDTFNGLSLADGKDIINSVLVRTLTEVQENNLSFSEGLRNVLTLLENEESLSQELRDKILKNQKAIVVGVNNKNALLAEKVTEFKESDDDFSIDEGLSEIDERDKPSYDDSYSLSRDRRNDMKPVLMKFLSVIADVDRVTDENGEVSYPVKTNIIDDVTYIELDVAYNKLKSTLANLKEPSFELMMEVLKNKSEFTPWFATIEESLTIARDYLKLGLDENQLRTAFVNAFSNNQYGYITIDYDGKGNGRVYNTDRSGSARTLMSNWQSQFKNTQFVERNENNELIINQDKVKTFLDRYEDIFSKKRKPVRQDLINFLNDLGVTLSNSTVDFIYNTKAFNKLDYIKQWNNEGGYLNTIYKKLKGVNEDIEGDLFEDFNPFFNNPTLLELAFIEIQNVEEFINNSARDSNGNILQSITPQRYLQDRLNEITEEGVAETLRKGNPFLSKPSDSFIEDRENEYITWIDKLAENKNLKLQFDLIESTKERFRSNSNKKLPVQSEFELERTKLILFNQGDKNRKFPHLVPTKSSNFVVTTNKEFFDVREEDGKIEFPEADNLNAYDLFYRIFNSEKQRIIKSKEPSQFYFFEILNESYSQNPTGVLNSDNNGLIKERIEEAVKNLIYKKVEQWQELGLIEDNKVKFFKNKKTPLENAAQFVLANMSYQFNMYQAFIGDPAFFAKSNLEDTFDNIFKRLTKDQAPGTSIALTLSGNGNEFTQLAFKDILLQSKVLENILKNTSNKALRDAYFKQYGKNKKGENAINITDAIEYTTWQEHLHILKQTGEISTKEYATIRAAIKSGKDLSSEQLVLITKGLFQSMKPIHVSVTRIPLDPQGITFFERPNYIKSSAFPLLPQFTRGTSLDNLRVFMEEHIGEYTRASAKSANKLGVGEPMTIADENGEILSVEKLIENYKAGSELNEDNEIISSTHSTILNRKNLRIQQEIPYKEEDRIIDASQPRKLSLALAAMNSQTSQIDKILDRYNKIFEYNFNEFQKEYTTDGQIDIDKLNEIISREAVNRGWSKADIKALEVDANDFYIPLFFNSNTKKVESLINSLGNNAVTKPYRTGQSYVLVPEAGLTGLSEDMIVTDSYDPKVGLLSTRVIDGKTLDAQVFVPSFFLDDSGNKVDIRKYTKEVDGRVILDNDKIPKELLKAFGYRIPTHFNFMQNIEIVGFLPPYYGNVIIAPSDFIVQMGSDFDIDKFQMFFNNTIYNRTEDKFEKLDDSHLSRAREKITTYKKRISEILKGESVDEKLVAELNKKKIYLEKLNQLSVYENEILEAQREIIGNPKTQELIKEKNDPGGLLELSKKYNNTNYSSLLSDQLASSKFLQGRSGAIGIGVFATLGTFQATLYSLIGQNNLPYFADKNGEYIPSLLEKGNSLMDMNTIDGKKSKLQIASYFLAAALDNEKEPILGNINANEITFGVIEMAILHGFNENQIVDFLNDKHILAFTKILQKESIDKFIKDKDRTKLASEYLKGKNEDARKTIANFNKLIRYGEQLRSIKSTINTDSKGLDPDFATNLKRERDLKQLDTSDFLVNAEKLIGEYEYDSNGELRITPKTINGFASVHGLMNLNNVWNKLLPYNSAAVEDTIKEIAELKGDLSVKDNNNIVRNLKTFYYAKALEQNSHFSISDMNYVMSEQFYTDLLAAKDKFKSKKLFDRITIDINSKNRVPILKYNAVNTVGFDANAFHDSFIELYQDNETTNIAKNIALYTYLNNPLQMSNNFASHIPPQIMKGYGLVDELNKQFDSKIHPQKFKELFLRNNPRFAPELDQDNILDQLKYNNEVYQIDNRIIPNEKVDDFLSNYNDQTHRWELYRKVREGKNKEGVEIATYLRMALLGDSRDLKYEYYDVDRSAFEPASERFLFSEITPDTTYDFRPVDGINKNEPKQEIKDKTPTLVHLNEDLTVEQVVEKLITNNPESPMAVLLSSLQGGISPTLSWKFDNMKAEGSYSNSEININNKLKDDAQFGLVFTHELLHSVFDDFIDKPSADSFDSYNKIDGLRKHLTELFKDNKDYQSLKLKYDSNNFEELTEKEKLYYPLVNNKEFITGIFTNKEFQDLINDKPYKADRTVFQRIIDIITEFLNKFRTLSGKEVVKGGSLGYGIAATLQLKQDIDGFYEGDNKPTFTNSNRIGIDPYINIEKPTKKEIDQLYKNDYVWNSVNNRWELNKSLSPILEPLNRVNYRLKATEILLSDKAKQVFVKGQKNNWDLNKILTELQIPKGQKQLILDLEITNREEIILELASNYSFAVEINTATEKTKKKYSKKIEWLDFNEEMEITPGYYYIDENTGTPTYPASEEDIKTLEIDGISNTQYYSNLTVPGFKAGTYKELRFTTPLITPSIKGHAQFAEANDIGWARVADTDPKTVYTDKDSNKFTIENGLILFEEQSDLFQKGRDKFLLLKNEETVKGKLYYDSDSNGGWFFNSKRVSPKKALELIQWNNSDATIDSSTLYGNPYDIKVNGEKVYSQDINFRNPEYDSLEGQLKIKKENQFLQLLNKDNNWVTFFVKSIIQDSAKKGYEKVLFPKGDTAAKIEGHQTLEEFKKQKEDRIKELESKIGQNFKLGNIYYHIRNGIRYKEDRTNYDTMEKGRTEVSFKEYENAKKEYLKDNKQVNENYYEIERLKQELADVESGQTQLSSIAKFYEETVTNILKKQGFNPIVITDEYGNTWNEIIIPKETIQISLSPSLIPPQEDGFNPNNDIHLLEKKLGLRHPNGRRKTYPITDKQYKKQLKEVAVLNTEKLVNTKATLDYVPGEKGDSRIYYAIKLEARPKPRISYSPTVKSNDTISAEKYFLSLEDNIKYLNERINDNKNIEEKTKLRNERDNLQEQLDGIAEANYTVAAISDVGQQQIESIRKILDDGKMSFSELDYTYRLLKMWSSANVMLLDEVDIEADVLNTKRLNQVSQEANILITKKWLTIAKELFQKASNEDLGLSNTYGQLFDKEKDIGIGNAYFRDASMSGSPLIQTINQYIKEANILAENELNDNFDLIEKEVEKLKESPLFKAEGFDAFAQTFAKDNENFKNGDKTGDLIGFVNAEFLLELNKLKKAVKDLRGVNEADYLKAVSKRNKFINDNNIFLDYNKLFDKETFEYKEDSAYLSKLVVELGSKERLDDLLSRAKNQVDKFKRDRNAEIQYIKDTESELNNELRLEIWDFKNDPFNYLNIGSSVKTIAGKKYYNKNAAYRVAKSVKPEWQDKRFDKILKDEKAYEFYKFVNSQIKSYIGNAPDHVKNEMSYNSLPDLPLSMMEDFQKNGLSSVGSGIHKLWLKAITERGVSNITTQVIDIYGKPDSRLSFPSIDGKYATEGERIRAIENKSYDLERVLKMLSTVSTTYKYKTDIEDKVRIGQILFHTKNELQSKSGKTQYKQDSEGNLSEIEKVEGALTNKKMSLDYAISSGLYGNSARVGTPFIDKKFYNKNEKLTKDEIDAKLIELDEQLKNNEITTEKYDKEVTYLKRYKSSLGGNVTDESTLGFLLRYTQLKGMALNGFSAITNLLFGTVSNVTYAAGEEDFNLQQYGRAYSIMLNSSASLMPGIMTGAAIGTFIMPIIGTIGGASLGALINSGITSNEAKKIAAIMKRLNILGEFNDATMHDKNHNRDKKSMFSLFDFYRLQRNSEYFVYGTTTVAKLLNTFIKDKDGNDISVYDAMNENAELNNEMFTEEQIKDWKEGRSYLDFKNRIDTINKVIHGNYDNHSPIPAKQSRWGAMFMQFRSWLPEGFAARWEDDNPDQILGRVRRGRWKLYGGNKGKTALKLLYKLSTLGIGNVDMRNLRTKTDPETGEVIDLTDDTDIANFKKNVAELMMFSSMVGLTLALRYLYGDDDDEDKKWYYFALNQIFRTQDDMMFYVNPVSMENITRNFAPVFNTGADLYKTTKYGLELIYKDDIDDADYDKFEYRLFRSVPIGGSGISNIMRSQDQMFNFGR